MVLRLWERLAWDINLDHEWGGGGGCLLSNFKPSSTLNHPCRSDHFNPATLWPRTHRMTLRDYCSWSPLDQPHHQFNLGHFDHPPSFSIPLSGRFGTPFQSNIFHLSAWFRSLFTFWLSFSVLFLGSGCCGWFLLLLHGSFVLLFRWGEPGMSQGSERNQSSCSLALGSDAWKSQPWTRSAWNEDGVRLPESNLACMAVYPYVNNTRSTGLEGVMYVGGLKERGGSREKKTGQRSSWALLDGWDWRPTRFRKVSIDDKPWKKTLSLEDWWWLIKQLVRILRSSSGSMTSRTHPRFQVDLSMDPLRR